MKISCNNLQQNKGETDLELPSNIGVTRAVTHATSIYSNRSIPRYTSNKQIQERFHFARILVLFISSVYTIKLLILYFIIQIIKISVFEKNQLNVSFFILFACEVQGNFNHKTRKPHI